MRNLLPLVVCFLSCSFLASSVCGQFDVKEEVVKKIAAAIPDSTPAKPKGIRKVLIFTKTNGFRHGSIPVAIKSLTMLGEETGAYSAVHSEDDSVFEPESLAEFDAVFMINTTGPLFLPRKMPKDPAERKTVLAREARLKASLVNFVSSGKGLAGTHSATDTYKNWKEYNDMMGGAFDGHPWHMEVPIRVLDGSHPLNKVFKGKGFTIADEIYQFRADTSSPKDRRILLTLAPEWKEISRGKREDKMYAISWIRNYGKGRTFYCSLGHRDEIYYNPVVLEHYLSGFQFVLGDLDADAEPIPVK
jgi:type 1 glutamine amidotransferase